VESEGVTPTESPERGATATEYALLCGFIAMVIVFGVGVFGTALNAFYGQMTSGVRSALGMP
jgi:pilus assembly protein Flp/PilA